MNKEALFCNYVCCIKAEEVSLFMKHFTGGDKPEYDPDLDEDHEQKCVALIHLFYTVHNKWCWCLDLFIFIFLLGESVSLCQKQNFCFYHLMLFKGNYCFFTT